MNRVRFSKLSGAGNDFILIDVPRRRRFSGPRLARRLCRRRDSIGADGLLLVHRGRNGTPELDYYNADGSRAFCGNGSRCAAWWIHRAGWKKSRFRLKTRAGVLEARITGTERVSVRMPDARGLRRGLRLKAVGRTWTVDFIDTGVPHAVVRVPAAKLSTFPLLSVGHALRRHRAFSPMGANINFVAAAGRTLRVRTYERGVENETLACGSGVVAAAVLAGNKRLRSIRVSTKGGAALTAKLRRVSSGATGIWLKGPVRGIYDGEVRL